MVIDIISYTDEQFAALTEEQLLKVQQAQLERRVLRVQQEVQGRLEQLELQELLVKQEVQAQRVQLAQRGKRVLLVQLQKVWLKLR